MSDDMTMHSVELPQHTLRDLLRLCTQEATRQGFTPGYVQVIREAVRKAVDKSNSAETGLQCRTMPSQCPCGSAGCTRPECSSNSPTYDVVWY